MAQRDRVSTDSISDKLAAFLDAVCRFLLVVGGLAALAGIAFVIYNYNAGSGSPALEAQAKQNITNFGHLALLGLTAVALAVTYLQWGEEVLGPLLIIAWAAFFFSPMYLPSIMGSPPMNAAGQNALDALQKASIPLGVIGLIDVILDVINRVKVSVREGSRADQLKYGKGVKEEKDIRNVILGKCWQLPYCRKFVRERCPIYHAHRTCWKERVGCMCDESVIRHAMEGRIIPSDSNAAAKLIPKDTKLTAEQKAERCRQCVIFNEHQKHKYKVAMPVAIGGMAGIYVLFHQPLAEGVQGAIADIDKLVGRATLRQDQQTSQSSGDLARTGLGGGDVAFNEVILVALLLVVLAYIIRLIEYMFFKAKV